MLKQNNDEKINIILKKNERHTFIHLLIAEFKLNIINLNYFNIHFYMNLSKLSENHEFF